LNKYYFTFGFGQVHQNGFHVIEAENGFIAREEMFRKFGNKWAFQYSELTWYDSDGLSQQEKYNLHEVK